MNGGKASVSDAANYAWRTIGEITKWMSGAVLRSGTRSLWLRHTFDARFQELRSVGQVGSHLNQVLNSILRLGLVSTSSTISL